MTVQGLSKGKLPEKFPRGGVCTSGKFADLTIILDIDGMSLPVSCELQT